MNGEILKAPDAGEDGLVLGEDGNRYPLNLSEVKGIVVAAAGAKIDFVPADGRATDAYVRAGTATIGPAQTHQATHTVVPPTPGLALGIGSVVCAVIALILPFVGLAPAMVGVILGAVGAGRAKAAGAEDALMWSRIGWISNLVMLAWNVAVFVFVIMFGFAILVPIIQSLGFEGVVDLADSISILAR
jgi:hypothetical protein